MKANSMKTIGKRLTFLILIMCVAVSISAQSYQLSGCVQDENNQPVEVANILLKQAKDSTYLTGMLTDAQGCFTFTQPKGEYLLHITLIGCEDIYLPVSLQGNKNVGMLTLKSSSTFLNEVTVTAARPVIKRLVDRVVFDTHNAIATAGGNALDLLREVQSGKHSFHISPNMPSCCLQTSTDCLLHDSHYVFLSNPPIAHSSIHKE